MVAPREGKTIWDTLHSIINVLDELAPRFTVGIILISFDGSMGPDVLKSLKQIHPELKSQNVKDLILKAINRLEEFLSGPIFDQRMN